MGDSIIYNLRSGKPNKPLNFLTGFAGLLVPDILFRAALSRQLDSIGKRTDKEYILSRTDYYIKTDRPEFEECVKEVKAQIKKLLDVKGTKSPRHFHMELGKVMWENCGMARSKESLEKALKLIPQIREDFWKNVRVVGDEHSINNELERAGRVADFLEFAEVMVLDALNRDESCGAHFRIEHQTDDGEAKRNDAEYSYASIWEYAGPGKAPNLYKEPITHDEVKPVVRSYK